MFKSLYQSNLLQQCLLNTFILCACTPVNAQIIPDNTMGSESSRVAPNTSINSADSDLINGGAQRGSNLFHSFSQFNINDGQRVYFGNPSGVENIFTRVIGGSASNIQGTLGVNGVANLFLMNPNGILFGKNASLDIRGSFVGTTANAIQFGQSGIFSATNPQLAPLLTINPSALLFNQIQANAGITNLSQAPAGVNFIGQDVTGLRVPDGQSLLLVGGNINVDGGSLRAYNGNVELAGLAAPGIVQLNTANNTFSLSVPSNIQRSNIFLNNGAEVNVRGSDAGNITINAQNLGLAEGSKLRAGIDTGLGTLQSKAGDITVNATKGITVSGNSFIANVLQANSVGQGGNINVSTGILALTDSSINGNTFGNGSGTNTFIKADGIFLNNGSIFNSVQQGAVGNTGNLTIDAGSISLINGSELNSKTLGQGNAGNINITAQDISIDGKNERIFSRITTAVNPEGVGKAGNIQINTNSLKVSNGAFISSDILGKGDGGNITINARDIIQLNGDSEISTSVFGQAITKGGDIQITTGSVSLTNGASIDTSVLGQGNAGNIIVNARDTIRLDGVVNDAPGGIKSDLFIGGVGRAGNIEINTGSLLITNGAEVSSDTSGRGDAGNITINTRNRVAIEGFGGSTAISRVASNTFGNELGNAGDIRITTGELLLKNGGGIKAFSGGFGKGGNINLDVANITTIDGYSAFGLASSIDTSTIGKSADAGNINLKTGSLFITNGGQMNTAIIEAGGNAGKITIVARDHISIDGGAFNIAFFEGESVSTISGLKSTLLNGDGRGGDIDITTGSLSVTSGAELSSSTNARGNAGNITINARDTVTFDGTSNDSISNASSVSLNTVGNGGDIRINAKALFLTNGSVISTSSFGQGNAGNIIINANNINIDGFASDGSPSGASSSTAGTGNGGDIQITTGTLALTNRGNIQTSSNRKAGNIVINARDAVSFDNKVDNKSGLPSGAFSFLKSPGIGRGGNIEVTTPSLSLTNGATLSSSTFGQGNGGDIIINARDTVKFDDSGASSTVEANAIGNAGNIKLTTGSLSLLNGGLLNATTAGLGKGGDIIINASNAIDINGVSRNGYFSGIYSAVNSTGIGKGGNITVQSGKLSLSNGVISSSGAGVGNAGDIDINSDSIKLDNRSTIAASTNSTDGGNIDLNVTDFLLLRRGSTISTTAGLASEGGNGGNIAINTPFVVAVPNEDSDITANAFRGNGGKVNIGVQSIFGIKPSSQASANSSDITASSQFGIQGEITIQQPEVQPTQAILELPGQVLDATNKISQICPRGESALRRPLGEFVVTGHGSLPPSPLNPLPGTSESRQLATLETTLRNSKPSFQALRQVDENIKVKPTNAIVEAQGLIKDADGAISLVALVASSTPTNRSYMSTCATNK